MRSYELMLVLAPDSAIDSLEKQESLVKKLVGDVDIHIQEVTSLGKKQLAYPIQKHKDGIYILVQLEASSLNISVIEKQARLGTDVIRYLLIAKN
ncbi:30S ribosomal protein S6 [Candidatus Gottesmanbacteria bacterium]|nr:30S ribosomal protein S6 [Candidatus Gottesmanbacteria bacterium]